MADFSWPGPPNKPFWPSAARWRQLLIQRSNTSTLSGYSQALGLPGSRFAKGMVSELADAQGHEAACVRDRRDRQIHRRLVIVTPAA